MSHIYTPLVPTSNSYGRFRSLSVKLPGPVALEDGVIDDPILNRIN